MDIAFDNSSSGQNASTSSLTVSHTTAGANRILFVFVNVIPATDTITGVTYGGVGMTLVDKLNATTGEYSYLFVLVNPAAGTNDIVASDSGTVDLSVVAASYTGASQTGQPDNHTTNTTTAATQITSSLTTIADNCWVVSGGTNDQGAISAGTGVTGRASQATRGIGDNNGAKTPAGSVSEQWTYGANPGKAAMLLASIAPNTLDTSTSTTSTSSSTSTTSTSSSTSTTSTSTSTTSTSTSTTSTSTSTTSTSTSTTSTSTSTTSTSTSTTSTSTSSSTTVSITTSTSSTTTLDYHFYIDNEGAARNLSFRIDHGDD